MNSSLQRIGRIVVALALAVLGAAPRDGFAQDEAKPIGKWDFIVSPYTYHFHYSEDHKYVYSAGLLRRLDNNWVAGGIAFSNSFGQPSAYAFVGQRFVNPFGWNKWYLQWTGGLLYGYVGEFKDKVPFNNNGFSPGFVPSIGYQFTDRVYLELDLLGNSALMFTLVLPLPEGTL
ncbi:MAG TPA: hypothetical protein PKC97_05650 [Burkholderiaceae bacterium]|jgi:hypothetical protein|nr:hypothetical protein [Burkholderiaceae bacterium]